MTFDYGSSYPGDRAKLSTQAAQSVKAQLATLGMNSKVGITNMIGVNDDGFIFTTTNAKTIYDYAAANTFVGLTSFWSLNRDKVGGSGITQTEFQFSKIFAGISSK